LKKSMEKEIHPKTGSKETRPKASETGCRRD